MSHLALHVLWKIVFKTADQGYVFNVIRMNMPLVKPVKPVKKGACAHFQMNASLVLSSTMSKLRVVS